MAKLRPAMSLDLHSQIFGKSFAKNVAKVSPRRVSKTSFQIPLAKAKVRQDQSSVLGPPAFLCGFLAPSLQGHLAGQPSSLPILAASVLKGCLLAVFLDLFLPCYLSLAAITVAENVSRNLIAYYIFNFTLFIGATS